MLFKKAIEFQGSTFGGASVDMNAVRVLSLRECKVKIWKIFQFRENLRGVRHKDIKILYVNMRKSG
jgi:hypothetical protein